MELGLVMNNVDKTILLAESFGADTSLFTSSYVDNIVKSAEYKGLVENVSWAQKFQVKKSIALIDDFKSINYRCLTFEDAVILASRVNYLYSVSSEAYYLNPLAVLDFTPKTKSVGELMCQYNGNLVSFNDIIADQDHPLNYKARAIAGQCESYRQEMIEKISFNYSKTGNNKYISSRIRAINWQLGFMGLVAFAAFLGSIYVMISRRSVFKSFVSSFSVTSFVHWGILACLIGAVLLCVSWILAFARDTSLFAPYYYFRRFGKSKEGKIYEKISHKAQQLAEYIFAACQAHKPLADDIGAFASAKTLDEELSAYKKMYSLKKDKGLKFCFGFYAFAFFFSVIAAIYTVAAYYIIKLRG
jgi:hypothetical protein